MKQTDEVKLQISKINFKEIIQGKRDILVEQTPFRVKMFTDHVFKKITFFEPNNTKKTITFNFVNIDNRWVKLSEYSPRETCMYVIKFKDL